VRNREAGHVDVADGEAGAGGEQLELGIISVGPLRAFAENGRRGEARNVNGNIQLLGDGVQSRDVIAVLVRDQNGAEGFGSGAGGGQALKRLLARKARVDEKARALGGNQSRVART
jgi:hypothetical protein